MMLDKLQFVNQACELLGDNSPLVRAKLDHMYDTGRHGDPKWSAVLIMRELAGPDPDNKIMVREFAARLGFDPSQL